MRRLATAIMILALGAFTAHGAPDGAPPEGGGPPGQSPPSQIQQEDRQAPPGQAQVQKNQPDAAQTLRSPSVAEQAQPESVSTVPDEVKWRSDPNVRMIAIEALVIEINEDRTRDIGIQYGLGSGGVLGGGNVTLGPTADTVSVPTLSADSLGLTSLSNAESDAGFGIELAGMNIGSNVVSMRIRALMGTGDASIRTRTIALALNNTETEIKFTSKAPYLDVSVKKKLTVNFEEVGVKMHITPTITDLMTGQTELNIANLEVSSVSSYVEDGDIDRPVFTTSNTQTRVRMREGETFVIGGLKSRRTYQAEQRIPVLGHIPLLGTLFTSHEEQERAVDVLFFITPHILEPGQNVLLPFDFENHQALGFGSNAVAERPAADTPATLLPVSSVSSVRVDPSILH